MTYGESVQTVAATAVSGVRLKKRMMPETRTNALDKSRTAERFGVEAIVFRAGGGQAQPVVTGSAGCSWWTCLASDRRCVMRPAPVVVRATLVFARDGRPR